MRTTVIETDVYVNSIGPVDPINMVSSDYWQKTSSACCYELILWNNSNLIQVSLFLIVYSYAVGYDCGYCKGTFSLSVWNCCNFKNTFFLLKKWGHIEYIVSGPCFGLCWTFPQCLCIPGLSLAWFDFLELLFRA